MSAGSVAESADASKETKYVELSRCYEFMPVAFETHGSFSKKSMEMEFVSERGRRISATTAEKIVTCFSFQRLPFALQRFNAICVSDTFGNFGVAAE